MKNTRSKFVEQVIFEMQVRNYSARTIETYTKLLTKLEEKTELSLDEISNEKLKEYLHHQIMKDGVSVSMVNQTISAFKTDIFKRSLK